MVHFGKKEGTILKWEFDFSYSGLETGFGISSHEVMFKGFVLQGLLEKRNWIFTEQIANCLMLKRAFKHGKDESVYLHADFF